MLNMFSGAKKVIVDECLCVEVPKDAVLPPSDSTENEGEKHKNQSSFCQFFKNYFYILKFYLLMFSQFIFSVPSHVETGNRLA